MNILKTKIKYFLLISGLTIFCLTYFSISYAVLNPGHDWTSIEDGFIQFTGPTAPKTFTLPNVTSKILTDYNLVQGDLIYADAASSTAKLAKDTNATRYLANTGTSNNPKWDLVNLANGVTGILSWVNGGTGNAFTTFTGQTLARTYTLPNATSTILTDNAAVTVAQGGTGQTSLTLGNFLVGNGASAINFLAPGAANRFAYSDNSTWSSATSADQVFFSTQGNRFLSVNASSTVTAMVSGTSHFEYLGVAARTYTSCNVYQRVTTAAVSITWAEVGIFSATTSPLNGGAWLARKGSTSVSGTYNSTGLKNTSVSSLTVNPGDRLWVAYGSSATTPFQVTGLLGDALDSGFLQTGATQLSTAGIPFAATLGASTTVPAWTMVKCQ